MLVLCRTFELSHESAHTDEDGAQAGCTQDAVL
jgi:hypothetical protein